MELSKDKMVAPVKYCLSYDTEVLTVEYGALPIGKIVEKQIDCNIYSVDKNGFVYYEPIAQYHNRGKQEVFEYTLDNGATIKATKDHKFMISDGQMLPIDEIFERSLDLIDGHSYIVDGYNFKKIIPDSYACRWYHGNRCGLGIIKFDSHYLIQHGGCTEIFRFSSKIVNESCLTNWMLSESIDYENYSNFVNYCINGYRNITYVKQQQVINSTFTIEQAKTPKHTYIALNHAIEPSIKLYKYLQESSIFSEKQLLSFSFYLLHRRFDNPFRNFNGRGKEDIIVRKEVFDYIIANPINIDKIVTTEMIEEFQQRYQEYQEDAIKYADETIEQRRDCLNKEIVAKGGRAMRFP